MPHVRAPGSPEAWHTRSEQDVAQRLDVDPETGLSVAESEARLERDGPNEIEEGERRAPWRIFVDQFRDLMIVILVVAAGVSWLLGEGVDAAAIFTIVLLNAVFGAVQEYRADRALAMLRKMSAPSAKVVRDSQRFEVPLAEVVPGDVVLLEAGDLVPADVRLVDVQGLQVEEAVLTGESVAIEKSTAPVEDPEAPIGDRIDMAYRGTMITRGRARGLTVATGMSTELGRIAHLLGRGGTVATPLQRRLSRFGRRLAAVVLVICAALFVSGVVRGESPTLMFLTAVSLAVAAIPEALPAVVSISLALGSRRMVEQRALVRRLPAAESLGSVTVICADKTGTLTQNRMEVEYLWHDGRWLGSGSGEVERAAHRGEGRWPELLRALAISNDAAHDEEGRAVGDPTEVALVRLAEELGFAKGVLEDDWPRIAELSFDAERKRMSTLHRHDGETVMLTKGAPEAVVPRCAALAGGAALDAEAVLATAEDRATQGYRVLAVAQRRLEGLPSSLDADEMERELELLGLVALIDPPRPEAADAVELCRSAGIDPMMITGDHAGTALAIARRLGIAEEGDQVVEGRDLEATTDEELGELLVKARVFARVSPEQKVRIVEALQERGELVAMTGDGVNDAPALKRAEIGVAMGQKGTDVAREAADMVLLDDNFATIVSAVREGRRIYDNIRKFVRYTMTSNSGEIWTLSLAPFLGLPLPLLPVQILWINLVTDGLPGLALAVEKAEPDVMDRPPRPPRESIFAHGLGAHALVIGFLIGALSLGSQAWSYRSGSSNWQTVVFTVLVLSQLVHSLVVRSERQSLLRQGLFSNRALLAAVALTVALQMAVVYWPVMQPIFHTSALSARELVVCFSLPLVVLVVVELEKLLVRRGLLYRDAHTG